MKLFYFKPTVQSRHCQQVGVDFLLYDIHTDVVGKDACFFFNSSSLISSLSPSYTE